MIRKNFLNEPKLILTQLDDFKYCSVTVAFQYNISHLFTHI